MILDSIFNIEDEKPLEKYIENGGFCSIFRTIGCIGDSLSSGEFQSIDNNGKREYHDMYEYSWGQFMARNIGSKVYNFSKGGMTAKEFYEEFATSTGVWEKAKDCQCFIIALGTNDVNEKNRDNLGKLSDIDLNDYKNNKHSCIGCYGAIIQRLQTIVPKAKFFVVTLPTRGDIYLPADYHADLIRQLPEVFKNTYVIDIRKYGPVYDEKFRSKMDLGDHRNPMGYVFTARMIESYIDYIIRHNMRDFMQVGFIGTEYYHRDYE